MFNNIKPAAQVVAEQTEREAQAAIATFKAERQGLLESAVVDANGFEFDADEVSIGRMANALLAASNQPESYSLQWSLADTPTGVMTEIVIADLRLAHRQAVENMGIIWGV
jgi:hypothetical protein